MRKNGVSIGYCLKVRVCAGEGNEAASCVTVIYEAILDELAMSLLKL